MNKEITPVFIIHNLVLLIIFLAAIFFKKRYLIIIIILNYIILFHWLILGNCFLTLIDGGKQTNNKELNYKGGFTNKQYQIFFNISPSTQILKLTNQVMWFLFVFLSTFRYTNSIIKSILNGLLFVLVIQFIW